MLPFVIRASGYFHASVYCLFIKAKFPKSREFLCFTGRRRAVCPLEEKRFCFAVFAAFIVPLLFIAFNLFSALVLLSLLAFGRSLASLSAAAHVFRRRLREYGDAARGCQKVLLFDKGGCGLTAAHALSAGGGRLARLQAEKYFLRRTCRRRK